MKLGLMDAGFERWEKKLMGEGPALDVGCATGALIRWLSGRGWQAQGLEICAASADRARSAGHTVYQVPLEEARLKGGAYSFVHASHVIEHLNDPRRFVREIYRILIPGGLFLCVTPNTRSLQALLRGPGWRSAIADHLVLFSAPLLRKLLEEGGFRIGPWKTWGGAPAGTLPPPMKRIVDRAAKKGNWGDVVMFLAEKPPVDSKNTFLL